MPVFSPAMAVRTLTRRGRCEGRHAGCRCGAAGLEVAKHGVEVVRWLPGLGVREVCRSIAGMAMSVLSTLRMVWGPYASISVTALLASS